MTHNVPRYVIYYNTKVVEWAMSEDTHSCRMCREQLLVYLNSLACPMCRVQDLCIKFDRKWVLK